MNYLSLFKQDKHFRKAIYILLGFIFFVAFILSYNPTSAFNVTATNKTDTSIVWVWDDNAQYTKEVYLDGLPVSFNSTLGYYIGNEFTFGSTHRLTVVNISDRETKTITTTTDYYNIWWLMIGMIILFIIGCKIPIVQLLVIPFLIATIFYVARTGEYLFIIIAVIITVLSAAVFKNTLE